jgi:AraC-like DNA-binding protein
MNPTIDLPIAERVRAFVEDNYERAISLRDVADALGYSSSHLTTAFRRATGIPVTAFIIERRIRAAKSLLHDPAMNIARTRASVGFHDGAYFSRQFARHVGMTPGRFRAATLGLDS